MLDRRERLPGLPCADAFQHLDRAQSAQALGRDTAAADEFQRIADAAAISADGSPSSASFKRVVADSPISANSRLNCSRRAKLSASRSWTNWSIRRHVQ